MPPTISLSSVHSGSSFSPTRRYWKTRWPSVTAMRGMLSRPTATSMEVTTNGKTASERSGVDEAPAGGVWGRAPPVPPPDPPPAPEPLGGEPPLAEPDGDLLAEDHLEAPRPLELLDEVVGGRLDEARAHARAERHDRQLDAAGDDARLVARRKRAPRAGGERRDGGAGGEPGDGGSPRGLPRGG